jgi:protein-S-isoprenylcysteine O-methyltransferase Ste14
MMICELITFIILSIIIVIFSWHSLFNIKAHGLYRFFAWECIAWLIVNNYKYWFSNVFSIPQIISWIFLLYAIFLIIIGVILIKKKGKADATRNDGFLYPFEKSTELIDIGVYKYIRHPMYSSLIFLTWGIYFKNVISANLLIISILSTVFLFITAKVEEKEDIKYFGEKYKEYIKKTKMFIPYTL